MARTHVTRTQGGKALPTSYGEFLDPQRVQDVMDKLDEHDTALDSGTVIYGIETLDGTTGKIIADLTKQLSYLNFSATKAFTLPDGTVTGQEHAFECTGAASTPVGTLTVTTPTGTEPATHVFTAVGQKIKFQWDGTGWHCVAKQRAGVQAVVVGTTVLTGYDMCRTYNLSVTGTVHSTGTKGIPNGLVPGEAITLFVTTASSTPLGDIDITATTNVGVAADNWGDTGTAINATTAAIGNLMWDGATWQATAAAITATLA